MSLYLKMKKRLIFLILLPILVACTKTNSFIQIEILEMNDLHGHIENEGSYGGLARAASLINEIRAETKEDNTVLIGNGDMLQETAIARVNYGKIVLDAMGAMQFDMMGLGNHEFDWGLDKILAFFDGNEENGEALFPLVNSNVYYQNELVEGNQVTSTLLVEKENVKVGILSYIGDVYSSISANMTEGYSFAGKASEIALSVSQLGADLKASGADIIVVNIHDGEASSCLDYKANLLLANLKYEDEYLVDAVINGHTHTYQDALISRKDGVDMPVIQSSGKLADFGRIDLTFDANTKKIVAAKTSHVDITTAKEEDSLVTSIIQNHYFDYQDVLEEVYCKNTQYISRYDVSLQKYALNVMMAATNATAACCNTGAFRNNVAVGNFDFASLYALNPFDNHIILCEISGIDLKRFYDANVNFEIVSTKEYGTSIATDQSYILAIVDYVYFSNYFAAYRMGTYVDTGLIVRDLICEDLRLRKETGFSVSIDFDNILISSYFS